MRWIRGKIGAGRKVGERKEGRKVCREFLMKIS
jgi:hypothetical protein